MSDKSEVKHEDLIDLSCCLLYSTLLSLARLGSARLYSNSPYCAVF